MLSAWLAADPGRATVLAAVAVLGWLACALLVVLARRAEREATSLLDAREEQLLDAIRCLDRLQRERDQALAEEVRLAGLVASSKHARTRADIYREALLDVMRVSVEAVPGVGRVCRWCGCADDHANDCAVEIALRGYGNGAALDAPIEARV